MKPDRKTKNQKTVVRNSLRIMLCPGISQEGGTENECSGNVGLRCQLQLQLHHQLAERPWAVLELLRHSISYLGNSGTCKLPPHLKPTMKRKVKPACHEKQQRNKINIVR